MIPEIYPFWEQSKSKTKTMIEDVIPYYLTGENQKFALDFVAYLRTNKVKPTWAVQNGWTGKYKGKVLYWIRLPQVKSPLDEHKPSHAHFDRIKPSDAIHWTKSYVITAYLSNIENYEEIIQVEGLQNFVMDNVHLCKPGRKDNCDTKGCMPGENKTLFGKEMKGLCRGDLYGTMTAWFVNPNDDEVRHIKRLLELEMQARK